MNRVLITCKSDTIYANIQYSNTNEYTRIGADAGIWLSNNQINFQLHRFTISEKYPKVFEERLFFYSHMCI